MKKIDTIKSGIISIISGFLGAFAGADNTSKNWRRLMIPLMLSGLAYSHLHSLWCLTIMLMAFALSLGYGIPDICITDYFYGSVNKVIDEGSTLGKFWYKIFQGNHLLADLFTRGTIGILISLSLISIPIITGKWLIYFITSSIVIKTYAILSWRDLGVFYFKEKTLLWSEAITYGIVGLMAYIMIYF